MKEEAVIILFKKAEDELLLHQIQVQNLVHIQKAFDIAKQKLEEDEETELEFEDLKEYRTLRQAQEIAHSQLEKANYAK